MSTEDYRHYKTQLEQEYATALAAGTVYDQESAIHGLAMLENAYEDTGNDPGDE